MQIVLRSAVTSVYRSLQAALLLFAFIGCEKVAPADAPIRTAAGAAPEEIIQLATAPIDTFVTLGDWLKKNPTDSVVAFPFNLQEEPPCRLAIAKSTAWGHQFLRTAAFEVSPPADEKLPDDTSRIVEQACRLRTVKFESDEVDSATAVNISESLASGIESKIGQRRPMREIDEAQRVEWINVKVWQTLAGTVILAIKPDDKTPRQFVRPDLRPPSSSFSAGKIDVVVLPPRGFVGSNDYWAVRYLRTVRPIGENIDQDLADADSAVAWARLPAAAADLQTMLAAIRRRRSDSTATLTVEADSALIRAIRTIQDSAPRLDPGRRAAAFVAGDLVRFAAVPYPPQYGNNPDRDLFDAAQRILLGADAEQSQRGYWFNRVWLWDAYEADSLGRAGHLAFVRMLKRGFEQSQECADSTEFYYTMIERGEADLRRGDKDPLVHFFVGIAYRSIFDYSNFVPEDTATYHNPSKAEGESARLRAIDHLRAALQGLTDKQMRRDAWAMAVDLMLRRPGLPPFSCAGEDD